MRDEIEDAEAWRRELGREKRTIRHVDYVQKHAVAHTAEHYEKWDERHLHEEEKIEGGTEGRSEERENDRFCQPKFPKDKTWNRVTENVWGCHCEGVCIDTAGEIFKIESNNVVVYN